MHSSSVDLLQEDTKRNLMGTFAVMNELLWTNSKERILALFVDSNEIEISDIWRNLRSFCGT